MTNFDKFCEEFNLVENALDMRTLKRWNGRDLNKEENLSEHTHLVVACAIELYDKYYDKLMLNFENIVRLAMTHDSLEMLRGDILSCTKDDIMAIRKITDDEETTFLRTINIYTETEAEIVRLADLKACYLFLDRVLRYPTNDFAKEVYVSSKAKFNIAVKVFECKYNIASENPVTDELTHEERFVKGYEDDAGVDVLLTEDIEFLPMSTATYDLKVTFNVQEDRMGFLCSRTSAASKGLIVAMCPIDPNFSGTVTAIVHNVSNDVIRYKKGEAFCQIVHTPMITTRANVKIKKPGKRSSGKLGSTGGTNVSSN